jgi:exo-beta-1,3-glucanase (GH17 family)
VIPDDKGVRSIMVSHDLARRLAVSIGIVFALLSGCGGGGSSAPDTGGTSSSGSSASATKRPLSDEFLSRKAVAYSGYRGADHNTPPTPGQVLQDLQLLQEGHFGLIRVFGSGDADTKVVLQTISDNHLDLKVQLGIWISGPKATSDADNQAEIARGIALANTYKDIVLAVSVGNETMVNWSTLKVPPADMAAYIQQVRVAVAQPVTTDDNWAFYADDGGQYDTTAITSVIDFASIHTYPLLDSVYDPSFDWKHEDTPADQRAAAMMDSMIAKAKADYTAVQTYFQSQGVTIPITIGETGWKAFGPETDRDHPANQKMYYDRLAAWTDGPKQIFYFEAFDEPWKGDDDGWGLFDVNRKARYVVQALYPADEQDGTHYTDADALYYIPPTSAGPVTASSYYLFADAVPAGAAVPSSPTTWAPWDSPPTASGTLTGGDTAEGANALQITPAPKSWGWGFLLALQNPEDLSPFDTADGYLNFAIKTTYPGALEVGFFTGSTSSGTGMDVYLAIAPGQYGYLNDGAWHRVSVPIAAIAAKAAPAYGQPATATLNMAQVTEGFVIADRYAVTGNATVSTTPVLIDDIYWDHH